MVMHCNMDLFLFLLRNCREDEEGFLYIEPQFIQKTNNTKRKQENRGQKTETRREGVTESHSNLLNQQAEKQI